jgi:hypothetical protein
MHRAILVAGHLVIALHPTRTYKNVTGTLSRTATPDCYAGFSAEAMPAIGGVSLVHSFRLRRAGVRVVKAAHAELREKPGAML